MTIEQQILIRRQRLEGQWQITTRTSRLLNGNPYAHTLLNLGLAGAPVPEQI